MTAAAHPTSPTSRTRPTTSRTGTSRTGNPRTDNSRTRPTDPRTRPTSPTSPTAARPGPRPLPAGRPREWYEAHNRQLKAMRLTIALLDAGLYTPQQARNRTIRRSAVRIGVRPPSNTTCRLVRSLLP